MNLTEAISKIKEYEDALCEIDDNEKRILELKEQNRLLRYDIGSDLYKLSYIFRIFDEEMAKAVKSVSFFKFKIGDRILKGFVSSFEPGLKRVSVTVPENGQIYNVSYKDLIPV